ncbi:MAG: DUF5104 domain-containing protein [Candidatus Weimeria sp.]
MREVTIINADCDYIMNGRLMQYDGRGTIEVTTNKHKKYNIAISGDIVNKENPENIGINLLFIYVMEGEEKKVLFKIEC